MLRGYKGTMVADTSVIGAQHCCAPTGTRFARWVALKRSPYNISSGFPPWIWRVLVSGDFGEAVGADNGRDCDHGVVAEMEQEAGQNGACVSAGEGEDDADKD